jgi:hypothetical protein
MWEVEISFSFLSHGTPPEYLHMGSNREALWTEAFWIFMEVLLNKHD